ncbi:hypothetical protein KB1_10890 [Cutibacterium modestum]|uniref:Uncharacterized protein n=1 Tax=Cutibacterium modestum TaxID=2559073 RepID=A0AAD1KP75_9ACTN|nr:hypothetical protein KB1_10890 [Cutibacterium modestum]
MGLFWFLFRESAISSPHHAHAAEHQCDAFRAVDRLSGGELNLGSISIAPGAAVTYLRGAAQNAVLLKCGQALWERRRLPRN